MLQPIKGRPDLTADELDQLDSQAGRCFRALMRGAALTRLDLARLKVAPRSADLSAIICKVERRFRVPVARARAGEGPMLRYWIEKRERLRYSNPKQRERQEQEVLTSISARRQLWGLRTVDNLATDYINRPAVSPNRLRQAGSKLIKAAGLVEPAAGGHPTAGLHTAITTEQHGDNGHDRQTSS
jgi:hypothetical protein